jgi:flagellin-like protein
MKGISPLIASVLLIAITMTLAAILATFVSNYTRQQLSALPSCVGGTLTYATAEYPKIEDGGDTVTAVLEAGNVDLGPGFTIEVLHSTGNVDTAINAAVTIASGTAGKVSNSTTFSGLTTSDKVRFTAKNCPSVRTEWTNLK